MNFIIERLGEKHLLVVDDFSCVESNDKLSQYNAKVRRRIIKHSKEMDDFLKSEAFLEQEKGLNTTHLLIGSDTNEIIGYVSLCNDSIQLDLGEQHSLGFTYCTVPAIKVARLAISSNYQGMKLGEMLLNFSAYIGYEIKEKSGLSFITLDCYGHRLSYYKRLGFVENVIQTRKQSHDSVISLRVLLNDFLERIGTKEECC